MKFAIVMMPNIEQIVLTPEDKIERQLLELLHKGERSVSFHKADFFETQGGYVRNAGGDRSTMIVLRPLDGGATP